VHALDGDARIYAIALLHDKLYVTRSGIAEVSVYRTKSLRPESKLIFAGLGNSCRGLATCDADNYLYVSDSSNRCIHRVSVHLSDTDMNKFSKWSVKPNFPRGISLNSANNVLVACSNPHKVKEYTPSGSLVREISDSNKLRHAVQLSNGILVVSRCTPIHGIATLSMDGQVIHSYGNEQGSGVGQMDEPRCIAEDKDGYILVADKNNDRILAFNPSLKDHRKLRLSYSYRCLRKPSALCLDQSSDRLYVGESGGLNRLLAFDNVGIRF